MNVAHLALCHGRAGLVLASAILVAGCSAAASSADPIRDVATSPPADGAPDGRPSDVPIQAPPLATVPPSTEPVVGEAPAELVAAARADLAGRVTATAAAAAVVIRSENVVWSDGSLGCPALDTTYVALETPGYWIVLRVDGTEYDYRVADQGTPRLCERLLPTNPGG